MDQKFFESYCTKNDVAKYFKNVAIYSFKYFVSNIMTHITMVQDKSKFLLLHNFMKCFSGTRVNQIVIINI